MRLEEMLAPMDRIFLYHDRFPGDGGHDTLMRARHDFFEFNRTGELPARILEDRPDPERVRKYLREVDRLEHGVY